LAAQERFYQLLCDSLRALRPRKETEDGVDVFLFLSADSPDMDFRHERIDDEPPNNQHMICLAGDLSGNGRDDIVLGARNPGPSVYWYENPGWECHEIVEVDGLESGGVLADINGNGRLDMLAGGHWGQHKAYWFEQPEDPRDKWEPHVICDDYHKYHDQAFEDVDDDGEPEVILISQNSEIICYYDIPKDPTEEVWPRENRHIVAANVGDTEGIQVLDIDDDGRTELVVGRRIFHRQDDAGEEWETVRVAPDWDDERVRVQAADVDEDGSPELVLSECELPALGARHGICHDGRIGIFSGPDWDNPEILRDDLQQPHSLQIADFDGDGLLDIYVAESDYGGVENPRHFVYEGLGDGRFEEHLIHEGTGTHEVKVADLTGDGTNHLVGKNDTEDAHVDVWYNEN
jgi:hypothetical protein